MTLAGKKKNTLHSSTSISANKSYYYVNCTHTHTRGQTSNREAEMNVKIPLLIALLAAGERKMGKAEKRKSCEPKDELQLNGGIALP